LALRLFIKILVPTVSVSNSWQGCFFVCVSKFGRGAFASPSGRCRADQRRSRIILTPKNTRQGRFFVLTQKSQKAGQVVFASEAPTNAAHVVGIVRALRGLSRSFSLQTAVRAKVPTNAAPMAGFVRFPWGFLCFWLKSAGRAHLHNRTAIVQHSCGFEGSCELKRRRYF